MPCVASQSMSVFLFNDWNTIHNFWLCSLLINVTSAHRAALAGWLNELQRCRALSAVIILSLIKTSGFSNQLNCFHCCRFIMSEQINNTEGKSLWEICIWENLFDAFTEDLQRQMFLLPLRQESGCGCHASVGALIGFFKNYYLRERKREQFFFLA